MYGHSQRGICSVAPLTLPSRELSRACVYLPPVCFEKSQTLQGKHKWGEKGNESHVELHGRPVPNPRRNQTLSVPKRNERAEWLLTAALSHLMTCEEALRFAQWWSGAPKIKSQSPHKVWQENTRRRRPLLSH